jgi:hypothetical protein
VLLIIVQEGSLRSMKKNPSNYGEKEANTNGSRISESMTPIITDKSSDLDEKRKGQKKLRREPRHTAPTEGLWRTSELDSLIEIEGIPEGESTLLMDADTGKVSEVYNVGGEAWVKEMRDYSDAKPSEVRDVYWIFAFRKKGKYPEPTSRSGKWLIYVNPENVDEVWSKIKGAVEEGRLGDSAKVSTAKPSSLATGRQRVICVYTYDWADEKDVKRIREELRKLGVTGKIPYKADQDTLKGKYRKTGYTKISKYYE